jgi:uncharacterized protein YjbI with pentapeptide repeats
MNKQDVLDNLDEVKKYVSEIEEDKNKKETNKTNIQIKNRWTGEIIFESEKTTWKEVVEEAKNNGADLSGADLRGANLRGANLCGANLSGANLRGAELCNAKFYGKGGQKELKKSQLPDFLAALGFKIVE